MTLYDMGYPFGPTVKEAEKFLINVSTTQQQLKHQCTLLNPKHGIIPSTVNSLDKARTEVKDID